MSLLDEYVDAVRGIDEIQAGGLDSEGKVGRNNRLADRIREIASEIETCHPELKSGFHLLLLHEKASVRIWAAHHILEVMRYDDERRKDALAEIARASTRDESVDSFGNRIWLKEWLREHPADKDLLPSDDKDDADAASQID